MVTQAGKQNNPSCRQCLHFYITYEPRQPMGCRAYGFKSRQKPADVVLISSGQSCQLFAMRTTKE